MSKEYKYTIVDSKEAEAYITKYNTLKEWTIAVIEKCNNDNEIKKAIDTLSFKFNNTNETIIAEED